MITTLISSFLGFFGAGFPKILDYFQDKQDKKHEITLLNLQMEANREAAKQQSIDRLAEIKAQENIQEIKSIYKTFNVGVKWVDALNGLVRPVIAFLLIGLYCVIEYMIFDIILTSGNMDLDMLEFLWGEDDQALFCAIIAYYFGSRAFNK